MTLADFARRHGVSKMAISKAIASGRLSSCVARDERGRPSITDAELADLQWQGGRRAPAPRDRAVDRSAPLPDGVPALSTSVAVKEAATARKEQARAELAEFDLAKRRGQLIDKEQARGDMKDAYTLVKTRLLGVPSRFAQRCPQYAAAVVPEMDKLIREALEELSTE